MRNVTPANSEGYLYYQEDKKRDKNLSSKISQFDCFWVKIFSDECVFFFLRMNSQKFCCEKVFNWKKGSEIRSGEKEGNWTNPFSTVNWLKENVFYFHSNFPVKSLSLCGVCTEGIADFDWTLVKVLNWKLIILNLTL